MLSLVFTRRDRSAERKLPRVIDRRFGLMALEGFDALEERQLGGMQRVAQRPPCQDCGVLHRTPCTSRYPPSSSVARSFSQSLPPYMTRMIVTRSGSAVKAIVTRRSKLT